MSETSTTSASLRSINTSKAPAPVGPYSQAIVVNNLVFVSGQLGLDPATGRMVEGDVAEQAKQVLTNLGEVLEAAGSTYAQVAKTTVMLADMNDFEAVNEVYATFFTDHKPARVAFQAAKLPKDALVEIEAIAAVAHASEID
jgi:2-iminobutanoate/2-iminopropanoate deaminase